MVAFTLDAICKYCIWSKDIAPHQEAEKWQGLIALCFIAQKDHLTDNRCFYISEYSTIYIRCHSEIQYLVKRHNAPHQEAEKWQGLIALCFIA